jgi:hypothetical protein
VWHALRYSEGRDVLAPSHALRYSEGRDVLAPSHALRYSEGRATLHVAAFLTLPPNVEPCKGGFRVARESRLGGAVGDLLHHFPRVASADGLQHL